MSEFHSLPSNTILQMTGIPGDLYYATDTKQLFVCCSGASGMLPAAGILAGSIDLGKTGPPGPQGPPGVPINEKPGPIDLLEGLRK